MAYPWLTPWTGRGTRLKGGSRSRAAHNAQGYEPAFARTGARWRKSKEMEFDRWVHENNPARELSYGKGWWDFIVVIQRLTDKLSITDVRVVSTFTLRTPPPVEELLSPVVRLLTPQCCVYVKEDFGQWKSPWTLSVERLSVGRTESLSLFLATDPVDERSLQGFHSDWIFPPDFGQARFTARLEDELDLYAVLRLLMAGGE